MKVYRTCWTVAVALLAGTAAIGVLVVSGWPVLAISLTCAAVLGAMVGLTWTEEAGRPMVLRCTAWSAAFAMLLLGLPLLLGLAALPVAVLVGISSPPVVGRALGHQSVQADEPAVGEPWRPTADVTAMTDRELEHRWRTTAGRLRHPGTSASAALELVAERAHLLDEIERRNPGQLAAILAEVVDTSDTDDGEGGARR